MDYFTDRYLIDDSVYKYTGGMNTCQYNVDDSSKLKIRAMRRIDGRNVASVKLAVAEQPVTAYISAGTKAFQNYTGGIFDEDACS